MEQVLRWEQGSVISRPALLRPTEGHEVSQESYTSNNYIFLIMTRFLRWQKVFDSAVLLLDQDHFVGYSLYNRFLMDNFVVMHVFIVNFPTYNIDLSILQVTLSVHPRRFCLGLSILGRTSGVMATLLRLLSIMNMLPSLEMCSQKSFC